MSSNRTGRGRHRLTAATARRCGQPAGRPTLLADDSLPLASAAPCAAAVQLPAAWRPSGNLFGNRLPGTLFIRDLRQASQLTRRISLARPGRTLRPPDTPAGPGKAKGSRSPFLGVVRGRDDAGFGFVERRAGHCGCACVRSCAYVWAGGRAGWRVAESSRPGRRRAAAIAGSGQAGTTLRSLTSGRR